MNATARRLALLSLLFACNTPSDRPDPRDAADAPGSTSSGGDAASVADGRAAPGASDGASEPQATDGMNPAMADAGASEARDGEAGRAGETFVYVGGADWSGKPFPYRSYRLERATGKLTVIQEAVDLGENPSYAVATRGGQFLYIANEKEDQAGVTVARIDAASGRVARVEHEPFPGGGGVVFTALDPQEKFVLAADYNNGRAAVFAIERDGKLSAPVDSKVFARGAHSHSIRTNPSGKWTYVPNKDANDVAQFAFDGATGKLTPLSPPTLAVAGGPRHIAFSPDGRFAFVMLEYGNKINAYAVGANGALTQVDSKSSLPAGFKGENTGAHVLVHPNGKFVYGSNRGHDSIVVFAVDASGKLTLVQHVPTLGKTPRNFDIDAQGELLVVANQGGGDDGSLVVFAIGADGKLTQRGSAVTGLHSPQSVVLVTLPR